MNKNDLDYLIDLKYGLLSHDQEEIIETAKSMFTPFLQKFKTKPYPFPESTAKEIDTLIKSRKKHSGSKEFSEILEVLHEIDDDIIAFIGKQLASMGINEGQLMLKLDEHLEPFILELKKHYNRPRPYQVAYYTGQKLEYNSTFIGSSPSYPSGSVIKALMICKIVSFHHKDKRDDIMLIPSIVMNSREIMGVNYPSDIEFSKTIVDQIMSIEKVKQKLLVKRKQKKEGNDNTPPLNGVETVTK